MDWQIARILLAERKLATLHELQTIYSTEDVYDMIELLEYEDLCEEEYTNEAKRKQQIMQNAQANKR
jgi:tagatose-1,6-bisphosphate aldolase